MKTFSFNGYRPLVDRQMPVKTLPYDKNVCVCVGGGVCPQGETWHQDMILSNSPKNCMKSMVYALNIFFSKVPAAKILHETSSRMSVADLRGALLACSPLWTKIFSISCSFLENLVKIICWHPHWRVGAPSYGNPGCTSGCVLPAHWL